MKLAYCIHSLYNSGGTERVLCQKANYLSDVLGYDVTIITACQKGAASYFPLSSSVKLRDTGVNFYGFGRMDKYRKALDRILNEIRPDITISLSNKELFILDKLSDGSQKIAEYHFSHDRWFLEKGYGSIKALFRTRKTEKCAAGLSRFVVLTKEDERRWEGLVPGLRQIYNPSPFDITESPLEEKTVMASGRLCRQKNFGLLIDAWKLVAEKHPDWTLKIFGEGEEKQKLQSQILSYGLEGQVILAGRSRTVEEEMKKSSALVMTSRYEGFPMILVEAQSLGLPLVSTSCPCGPSELIENGVNGFLVEKSDKEAVSEALCRLIEDPQLRKAMGKASCDKAMAFTKEKIMSQWDSLFKELI